MGEKAELSQSSAVLEPSGGLLGCREPRPGKAAVGVGLLLGVVGSCGVSKGVVGCHGESWGVMGVMGCRGESCSCQRDREFIITRF